tara:strand:+ start:349 stop:576 length:228 start_codon:yes stop_codon:yes gene_type:complete
MITDEIKMYKDKYSNQNTSSRLKTTKDGYVLQVTIDGGLFLLGQMKFDHNGKNITTDKEMKDLQGMIEFSKSLDN